MASAILDPIESIRAGGVLVAVIRTTKRDLIRCLQITCVEPEREEVYTDRQITMTITKKAVELE